MSDQQDDPKHDPEAARAAIKRTLQTEGKSLSDDEVIARVCGVDDESGRRCFIMPVDRFPIKARDPRGRKPTLWPANTQSAVAEWVALQHWKLVGLPKAQAHGGAATINQQLREEIARALASIRATHPGMPDDKLTHEVLCRLAVRGIVAPSRSSVQRVRKEPAVLERADQLYNTYYFKK